MNWDYENLRNAKIKLNNKVNSQISELEDFAEKENLDVEWVLEMFAHKFTCRINEIIGARADAKVSMKE